MKVIKEEQYNSVTQQKTTKVYIEIDGEREFFGQASEPQKVFSLIGEANAFIEHQEVMNTNQQVEELSDILAEVCFEIADGITYGMMTNEQKAQVMDRFYKEMKKYKIKVTNEMIDIAEKEMMSVMASMLRQYKYYTQSDFPEAVEQLTQGRKVTIVKFSEFGFPVVINTVIDKVVVEPYAQYKESLKIIHKPKRKRSLYANRIIPKDALLVYDGWLDIDLGSLTKTVIKQDENVTVTQSKYRSFDKQLMQDAISSIIGKLIVKMNVL